ncbi:MAG TPA: hypothetical protein VM103_00630 [Candidatus Paceibacterota bacterium]|nr:hypothetical protein [Candidatus Paceibacterota bacterium]
MTPCPDCGNAPVNHKVEWISAVLEKVLTPHHVPFRGLWQKIDHAVSEPLYNTWTPLLMKALVALRFSSFADAPDAKTNTRAKVMWEEATKRGISVREFRLFGVGREAFLAEYQGQTKTFLDLPRPNGAPRAGLAWMGNKEVLRQRLSARGIPAPAGGVATSVAEAKKLFATLQSPVITKPESGSRSRHTTTHLNTEADLVPAFTKAAQLTPWVIVQEELVGFVHRGTLVGGKLVAVLRREPPMVIGDGVHTIAELIAIENKNPRRDNTLFHTLEINPAAREELERQGVTLQSKPEKGKAVTLSQKTSRGIGGGATDMTDVIHPDNRAMLEMAAAIIDDPLMGIDFIMEDVTKSWKEQKRSGIIESNSMPFIDIHHYPLVGAPRNVAGALWDIVFPRSRVPKTIQPAEKLVPC